VRRLAVLVVVAAFAVSLVSSGHAAKAQYGTPYWQVHTAIDTLISQGLDWNGGTANIRYIWCQGFGNYRYSYLDRAYLYSHFKCHVWTDVMPTAWIEVDTGWWWQWNWHLLYYG